MSASLSPIDVVEELDDIRLAPPVEWHRATSKTDNRILAVVITLNVLAAFWYLSWLLQPSRVGNPYLYGMLVAAEAFNIIQALGFWWTVSGRDKSKKRAAQPPLPPSTTVDVFIPTYSESVDIVEPTIMRAMQLTGADVSVWLLDDGSRPAMEELAERYGAGYITRVDHSGAKAGNINHALKNTTGQYVLVLDCDHVPLTHFLEATLPEFNDSKVAFVQTPQYYANFEESPIAAGAWSQQAIFFGAILEGKNKRDAAFCCGTNVVFNRSALEGVGGFPTNSLTEDFELSVRMHEAGWKTRYVAETLASGLGPEDMASYVSQQHRWARGCLSAIPRVLKSKLPFNLRLQYLMSAAYFFSGFTVLAYMSLPFMNIVFGVQPLSSTTSDQFLIHFAPYYALCLYTLARAGRGSFNFSAFTLASASFWIQIHACYRWLFRRPSKFVVTPKEGVENRQIGAVAPALVAMSLLIGAAIYGLTKSVTPGTLNNVAFALLHVSVLAAGLWPALVIGQGKVKAVIDEPTIDLTEEAPKAYGLALVESLRSSFMTRNKIVGLIAAFVVVVGAIGIVATHSSGGSSSDEATTSTTLPTDQAATKAANNFLTKYVDANGRVVRHDQGDDTVSEGQAYGMLISVGVGDGARFDAIWNWSKANLQQKSGVLAWRWQNGAVVDTQGATDADMDAAYALSLASVRFKNPAYAEEAKSLSKAILDNEIFYDYAGAPVLMAGPWATAKPYYLNPSYISPRVEKNLADLTSDARWPLIMTRERTILNTLIGSGSTIKLPPDWAKLDPSGPVSAAGAPATPDATPTYSYDALRTPIRLAYSCDAADVATAAKFWPVLSNGGYSSAATFSLDGKVIDKSPTAVGSVSAAAAATAAGKKGSASNLFTLADTLESQKTTYYGAAWAALGRIMFTTPWLGGSCLVKQAVNLTLRCKLALVIGFLPWVRTD